METINFGEEQNNSAPKVPNNRNKKLIWTGVILAALILSVIGWQYWQYIHSTYYQQMKAVKALEKLYADDTMGGKTPEETLALFLEAVKKEDFDLASQYAIFDLRQEVHKSLNEIKDNNKIDLLVGDLGTAKIEVDEAFQGYVNSVVYRNGKRLGSVLTMSKNKSEIWKIIEF